MDHRHGVGKSFSLEEQWQATLGSVSYILPFFRYDINYDKVLQYIMDKAITVAEI